MVVRHCRSCVAADADTLVILGGVRAPLKLHALKPVLVRRAHVADELSLGRQDAARGDRLLDVEIPVEDGRVIRAFHSRLPAERLVGDGIHDPLVVDAVLLADQVGIVLRLQRGVDEQGVRRLESELRHLVSWADVESWVPPSIDCAHPALHRITLPIEDLIVEARARFEEVCVLLSEALVDDEVQRVLRAAMHRDGHRGHLELPRFDGKEKPGTVLAVLDPVVVAARIFRCHQHDRVRVILVLLCWRVLKVESVRRELECEPFPKQLRGTTPSEATILARSSARGYFRLSLRFRT